MWIVKEGEGVLAGMIHHWIQRIRLCIVHLYVFKNMLCSLCTRYVYVQSDCLGKAGIRLGIGLYSVDQEGRRRGISGYDTPFDSAHSILYSTFINKRERKSKAKKGQA